MNTGTDMQTGGGRRPESDARGHAPRATTHGSVCMTTARTRTAPRAAGMPLPVAVTGGTGRRRGGRTLLQTGGGMGTTLSSGGGRSPGQQKATTATTIVTSGSKDGSGSWCGGASMTTRRGELRGRTRDGIWRTKTPGDVRKTPSTAARLCRLQSILRLGHETQGAQAQNSICRLSQIQRGRRLRFVAPPRRCVVVPLPDFRHATAASLWCSQRMCNGRSWECMQLPRH